MVNATLSVVVECYSGHTYAQRPTAFVQRNERHTIERILEQWRSPDGPGFRAVTTDGIHILLAYHEMNDKWYLQRLPDPPTRGNTPADVKRPDERDKKESQVHA